MKLAYRSGRNNGRYIEYLGQLHWAKALLCSTILICLSYLLCIPPSHAREATQSTGYAAMVNLAGRQRMLLQKLSKEVLFISLNSDSLANLTVLADTTTQFNQAQHVLMFGSDELGIPKIEDDSLIKDMQKSQYLWQQYSNRLSNSIHDRAIDKELLVLVAQTSDTLLEQLEKVVSRIQQIAEQQSDRADIPLAKIINVAGRQRMLTQKMTKECLLIEAGHNVEINRKKMAKSQQIFEQVLKQLSNVDSELAVTGSSFRAIQQQLVKVETFYQELRPQLTKCGTAKSPPLQEQFLSVLAHQNLALLHAMNRAVVMYEELASR